MLRRINYLTDYFRHLKNPIQGLLFKFKLKKEYEAKLKNYSNTFLINEAYLLNKLMNGIVKLDENKAQAFFNHITKMINDEKYLNIDGVTFINIYNSQFRNNNNIEYSINLEENFYGDDWGSVEYLNRYVVDIGSNVADTSLLFANKGAKVLAFEPVKHIYELGLKNIELNPNLKDNIIAYNKAVGGKKGTLNITLDSIQDYVNDEDNYDIEVITIKEVLELLKENNMASDVLKMDCEGCEFEIILKEDLSMFQDIIFEHHSKMTGKDYHILIDKLVSQGFKINTYPAGANKKSFEEIGIIHAFKWYMCC